MSDFKLPLRLIKEQQLSAERLRERLLYDPLTGKFTWLKAEGTGLWRGGLEAGHENSSGYTVIHIDGLMYLAHRLAWLHVYGRWPIDQIDHSNTIRNDNRILNLREATNRSNHANRTDNKSGHVGVLWEKSRKKWKAYARIDYVMHNIGRFNTFNEAVLARNLFMEANNVSN